MNIKLIFATILLNGIGFYSFSQNQVKEFEILKSQKVKNYGFSDNGNFFVNLKNKTSINNSNRFSLLVFDNNELENLYEYFPKENFRVYDISPDGKKVIYDYSKGISLKYKYGILNREEEDVKLIKDIKLKGDLYDDPIFRIVDFTTDNNYYAIGRKKRKETKNHILTRSLASSNINYSEFKLPLIDTEKEFLRWKGNKNSDNKFVLLSKDLIDSRNDKYHVVVLDERSKEVELITLNVELDEFYLCASNNGGGFWDEKTAFKSKGGIRSIIVPSTGVVGNLYVDIENNSFYTYGMFSDKESNLKYAKPKGFYIYKFDWKGNLIWKNIQEIKYKDFNKKQYTLSLEMEFKKISEEIIGLTISSAKSSSVFLYSIGSEGGKIVDNKEMKFKTYTTSSFGSTDNLYSNEFISDYILKDTYSKKIILDINTLMGAFFNIELEKYLKSKIGTKNKLHFISDITDSGITVLESDNKDNNFKLMKFYWHN